MDMLRKDYFSTLSHNYHMSKNGKLSCEIIVNSQTSEKTLVNLFFFAAKGPKAASGEVE